jgi:hypothetical protein
MPAPHIQFSQRLNPNSSMCKPQDNNNIAGWATLFKDLEVAPFLHVSPQPPHTSPEAKVALSSLTADDIPRLKCIARYLSAAWKNDYAKFVENPDSEFGKLLRTTPWMVGTDGQTYVPSDLWWSGMKDALLGDGIVRVGDEVIEPLASALGVRFEVTVEAVVEAMKSWIEDGTELSVGHMHK